jgi:hypothetical protein
MSGRKKLVLADPLLQSFRPWRWIPAPRLSDPERRIRAAATRVRSACPSSVPPRSIRCGNGASLKPGSQTPVRRAEEQTCACGPVAMQLVVQSFSWSKLEQTPGESVGGEDGFANVSFQNLVIVPTFPWPTLLVFDWVRLQSLRATTAAA